MIAETIAAGVAAGVLSGLFGIGGGAIFVPALVLLFNLGQATAEGTSLLAIIPVAALGTWRQWHEGLVDRRTSLVVGLVSGVGVAVGTFAAVHLPQDDLRRIFAGFLLLVAWQLIQRSFKARASRLAEAEANSQQP